MSKIETHEVCTNLDEITVPPELTHRLMIGKTHQYTTRIVVRSLRSQSSYPIPYLKHSKFLVFRLAREEKTQLIYIKFAKYLLASINLLDSSQAIANHNLNVLASHIHAFLILPGFVAYRYEYCGITKT